MRIESLYPASVLLLLVVAIGLCGCSASGGAAIGCPPGPSLSPQPSGTLVDGVRVVRVVAVNYKFMPEVVVVNACDRVRIEMTSRDLFYHVRFKGLDASRTLVPYRTEALQFVADRSGAFPWSVTDNFGPWHDVGGTLLVLDKADLQVANAR